MSLLEKALKKIEESKKIPEKKIIPGEKKEFKKKKPSKPTRITGDKDFNKDEICNYLANLILTNKENLTLDWLRGQKLTFDSVNEMRKKG